MQSFAGKVKNELCRVPVQRLCCARAEAYGVLLYGNTFSPTEVRLITESADFAARLPRLFQRAFGLKFDRLPEEERGKLIFGITDRSKLDRIINQLGYDPRQNLVLHVNFGLLEDECCRTAFLRGAFLAGGSVTDPEKRYHLELDTESTVSITANASVYRMTASKPASVTGYGTIYQAEIKSSGVSFASSVRVSGYTIANGVTAIAGGQTLTGSVTAAVSPESIAVDLNNLSALGKNVAVTVPNGLKIEKIESNGAVLAAGTDYTQTSTGAAISVDWLGRLPRGSYKLTLMLSDGKTTAIAIAVTDSSVSENVQNASFDRYYKSEKYADVHTRLSGANTSEDIRDVVLGLSSIDYTFDSSTRSLILPRGVLAQLRAGSYTISVELKNGKTEAFTLTVSDSAPTGESWAVEEYNTFSPSEPKFTLPLTRTSVRTVTVQNSGVTETLNAGSDYTISGQTLTLKKSALERYRKDGTAVVFSADLADGTAYALVIDYVKRK